MKFNPIMFCLNCSKQFSGPYRYCIGCIRKNSKTLSRYTRPVFDKIPDDARKRISAELKTIDLVKPFTLMIRSIVECVLCHLLRTGEEKIFIQWPLYPSHWDSKSGAEWILAWKPEKVAEWVLALSYLNIFRDTQLFFNINKYNFLFALHGEPLTEEEAKKRYDFCVMPLEVEFTEDGRPAIEIVSIALKDLDEPYFDGNKKYSRGEFFQRVFINLDPKSEEVARWFLNKIVGETGLMNAFGIHSNLLRIKLEGENGEERVYPGDIYHEAYIKFEGTICPQILDIEDDIVPYTKKMVKNLQTDLYRHDRFVDRDVDIAEWNVESNRRRFTEVEFEEKDADGNKFNPVFDPIASSEGRFRKPETNPTLLAEYGEKTDKIKNLLDSPQVKGKYRKIAEYVYSKITTRAEGAIVDFIDKKRIAKEIGCSEETVRTQLKKLLKDIRD